MDDDGHLAGSATATESPVSGRLARDLPSLGRVVDAMPIGVAVTTPTGRIAHANPVLGTLVGHPSEALVGSGFERLLAARDSAGFAASVEELAAGRRNFVELEVRGRAPSGGVLWLRATLAAVYGPDGSPAYLVAQVFDFAGSRSRDDRLRRLAMHAPVMLWLTDEHGFPRLGNRVCVEFVEAGANADLAQAWTDAMHPEDLEAASAHLEHQIGRREPFDFLARARRRDGVWRWLHHWAHPVRDASGDLDGYAGASIDVTEREETRRDLHDSQQLFAGISEAGPLAVVRTDPEGRITYFNGRWAELLEDPRRQLAEFGWHDILSSEHLDQISELGVESVATGEPFTLRVRARNPAIAADDPDGEFWGEIRGAPIYSTSGQHVGFTATLIDVTAEVTAAQRADRLAQVLDASSDLVILARPTGAISYANDAAIRALGLHVAPDRVEGSFLWDILDPDSTELYYDAIEPLLHTEGVWRGELSVRRSAQGTVPVSALFLAHADDLGRIESISAVARDITELKEAEERLRHLATHDNLTGLPNRALLYDRLEQALARHHRLGHGVALLFCDLDRFKPVNDELGHDAGDAVLRVVADRISEVVRTTDTAARVGGDEFVVLVEGIEDLELLRSVAGRLVEAVHQPIDLGDAEAQVGVSVGLVAAAEGRDDADTLMRLADRAMYRAKGAGRGRVEVLGGAS